MKLIPVDKIVNPFWSQVDKSGDCWVWIGHKDQDGYGIIAFGQISYRAHRVAYAAEVGEITPGMLVCHRCDNPSCVRPSHLFLGDHLVNQRDKWTKNRGNKHKLERTACRYGHPYTPETTYLWKGRIRVCRICKKHFARLREARHAA